jgi:hypothetical protein
MAANLRYFEDAIKRHGGSPGNAADLLRKYQKSTKGLDSDLAFKALSGGRVFGDSDKQRYEKLLASKKEKQSASSGGKTSGKTSGKKPGNVKGSVKDAKVDLKTFQSLLDRLEASKKRQQRQQSVEGRRDIYAGGMASMMSNF